MSLPTADKNGVRVNGVNYATWERVVSAKKVRFIGLPYVIMRLDKRLPPFYLKEWWLPLYIGGATAFHDAVKIHAPINHPLRVALDESFDRLRFVEILSAILYVLVPSLIIVFGVDIFFDSIGTTPIWPEFHEFSFFWISPLLRLATWVFVILAILSGRKRPGLNITSRENWSLSNPISTSWRGLLNSQNGVQILTERGRRMSILQILLALLICQYIVSAFSLKLLEMSRTEVQISELQTKVKQLEKKPITKDGL
jgi:hypothetical protein